MSAFEDLKKAAEAKFAADEVKAKSWFAAHKTVLILGGVGLLIAVIGWHILKP